jgi:hypothetical protein
MTFRTETLKAFFSGLLSGVSEPSRTSVALFLAIPAVLLLLLPLVVTPGTMAGPLADLFCWGDDDTYCSLTSRALRLAEADPSVPRVVVVGGSITGTMFRERPLADAYARVTGDSVEVDVFTGGRMTFWEMEAIADLLPDGATGVLLLVVGPSRFTRNAAELDTISSSPRLALDEDLNRERADHGLPPLRLSGNYFIDNRRFFSPRLRNAFPNLVFPVHPRPRDYTVEEPLGEKEWEELADNVVERFRRWPAEHRWNGDIVRQTVQEVRDRTDMEVVLVDHTINPRFREERMTDAFSTEYHEYIDALASETGVRLLIADTLIHASERDYYDWGHIRNAAVRDTLSARIGTYLGRVALSREE